MGFLVAARAIGQLRLESAALLVGIVQLAERVGNLHPADIKLEPFDRVRIIGALLGQRRNLGRVVVDKGRLDQQLLDMLLENLGRDLSWPPALLDVDAQPPGERGHLSHILQHVLANPSRSRLRHRLRDQAPERAAGKRRAKRNALLPPAALRVSPQLLGRYGTEVVR